jgi:hypothetical protein
MPVGERDTVPRLLPLVAQVTTITLANDSEAGTLTIDVEDDASGQEYSVDVTISSGTEATSLDEMLEACEASELRKLFDFEEDGSLLFTMTAKHAGRSYTVTTTPPGSMTATVAEATASDDDPTINFGRMVARGSDDGTIAALGASTSLSQLEGIVFRTDGNHFHSLENDTPSASDELKGGKELSVMKKGRCWVQVETDVTPASTVYVRRATTSGAGAVGRFRDEAAGSTQVSTITPVADSLIYAVEYGYAGVHYTAQYVATDGTTSVADACDGLYDALEANNPTGVTVADATTSVTLTAAAGTQFDYVRVTGWSLDTEAASATVSTATADVDTINVSSICSFETSASAGGLALLRIHA